MNWDKHIRDFEAYLRLERNLSDNSVQAYLRDVEHLRRFAEPLGLAPEAIGKEQMNDLLKALTFPYSSAPAHSSPMRVVSSGDHEGDEARSPRSRQLLSTEPSSCFPTRPEECVSQLSIATQCRLISGWRAFFRMLVIDGTLKENPAELLDMPTRGKHLPDVLTDEDVTAMQATLDRSLPGPARNYVIIEVLYGCGLRVSELVNLKLSNIYAEDEMLQIFGKGNKERWVPINPHALRLLQDYIQYERSQLKIQPGEEKYVFLNLRGHHLSRIAVFQFIKEAAEKAGIRKKISPHSLRHTFATELVQNGADLRAVQEMLGHESLSTTEIYTHLSRQFLRETLHTYHPHYMKS